MIRYYTHNDIDRTKWNDCIRTSLYPTVFADFDFLTFAAPNWGALVEDDYISVMPLPQRSKFFIKYIFTPYGFVRLGIFSQTELSENKINEFINSIPRCFKQIDLFMNPTTELGKVHSTAVEMVSHKLDLSKEYAEISGRFSDNARRNIKKSRQSGLTFNYNANIHEIVELFKNNKGKEKKIKAQHTDYKSFEKTANYASALGLTETICLTDSTGQIVAGAIFLKDYDKYRFWFSGRDNSHNESRPLFLIMDEFIKTHSGEHAILDFDGSRDENVARFYRGFGGEKFTFPMLNISRMPLLSPIVSVCRKLRKR